MRIVVIRRDRRYLVGIGLSGESTDTVCHRLRAQQRIICLEGSLILQQLEQLSPEHKESFGFLKDNPLHAPFRTRFWGFVLDKTETRNSMEALATAGLQVLLEMPLCSFIKEGLDKINPSSS